MKSTYCRWLVPVCFWLFVAVVIIWNSTEVAIHEMGHALACRVLGYGDVQINYLNGWGGTNCFRTADGGIPTGMYETIIAFGDYPLTSGTLCGRLIARLDMELPMRKYTLTTFNAQFPDDDSCLDFLFRKRWPSGVFCQICQRITKHHRITGRKTYGCQFCGNEVSPAADTIFHKSPTPLRSWFYAMFLMAQTRTGISAKQLQRELGVTYKTAWRMFTQIRTLMAENGMSLFGNVEADETYIGGKRPGKRGRGAEGKTVVFGMVERGGRAFTQVTPDVKAKTLLPIIQEHIPTAPGTIVYTDELRSYGELGKLGYAHETVQHAARQYVNGSAHVNNVESLWSNTKRGIDGVHHSVSPKYLQHYLDSYTFRFNHRNDNAPMFVTLIDRLASDV